MERLITVEEHFISATILPKCNDVIARIGTEEQKRSRAPMKPGSDPLSHDIGAGRISHMDKMGITDLRCWISWMG